jgi:hypothetical protein
MFVIASSDSDPNHVALFAEVMARACVLRFVGWMKMFGVNVSQPLAATNIEI